MKESFFAGYASIASIPFEILWTGQIRLYVDVKGLQVKTIIAERICFAGIYIKKEGGIIDMGHTAAACVLEHNIAEASFKSYDNHAGIINDVALCGTLHK